MARIIIALLVCGVALVKAQSGDQDTINLPLTHQEWNNFSSDPLVSSGNVRLRFRSIYMNPHAGGRRVPDAKANHLRKPAEGTFVIAVNPGDGCEGVSVIQTWELMFKDTTGIDGASPNGLYFIQQGDAWYANDAGFYYGYDSDSCGTRSFTAEVITGGQFVEDVNNAPHIEIPEPSE